VSVRFYEKLLATSVVFNSIDQLVTLCYQLSSLNHW